MSVTPMMKQYHQIKEAHPGALLLFRMGDFYEMFFDDAETAARVLGLALTSRDKGSNPIPMAGFPYHALEGYLGKLIRAGLRVAICDQVEDPRQAKGLVRREVTRIVTAGTLLDEELLEPRRSNYLAAVAPGRSGPGSRSRDGEAERVGIAWVELSTGTFQVSELPAAELSDELGRIEPAECIAPEVTPESPAAWAVLEPQLAGNNGRVISHRPAWCFAPAQSREALLRHLGTATLEGFDLDEDSPAVSAAGALVQYLTETHKASLEHITRIVPYRRGATLVLDEATRRSLELMRTQRDGGRDGALLGVLDETMTPMGARLLAEWLGNPLTDREAIVSRHEALEELVGDAPLCRELRDQLGEVYDLERLSARVSSGRASPRDLGCVNRTLGLLPGIKAKLTARRAALLMELEAGIDLCSDLRAALDAALVDEPPIAVTEGGIIREGYDAKLDQWRQLAAGGKQWIARYQADEVQRSGIPSLKVGFNRVFGYYLEVTNTHAEKVPDHYIRKQTLKNAERYVTAQLKEHEEKVLQADVAARDLEYELFGALRQRVAEQVRRLLETARILATADVLLSLATVAQRSNYTRPEMVEEPVLELSDSRHPVLDRQQPSGEFVPNDVTMGEEAGRLLLVTGPNMAGKSTYIRQVALVTLMAQMGSFVPARRARIGIADRIFARVGASDELSRGRSTFMVEMVETARILNTATERSLIILDEIGRGTSTYDGVSLAWAVAEYLHDQTAARTLFATHYHELTELASTLPQVRNLNVAVREWQEEIIFLHKIVEGGADKSYGLHVARLAGVPREVIERAKTILATLESDHLDVQGRPKLAGRRPAAPRGSGATGDSAAGKGQGGRSGAVQLSLFARTEHPILSELRAVDVDRTTPLDALRILKVWQEQLEE